MCISKRFVDVAEFDDDCSVLKTSGPGNAKKQRRQRDRVGLSMAVKQVLSKDFAKCWTKYMSDGASGSFLKATSAIFQRATNKHQQDCVAVVQSVLHNYVAGAPLVADELSGVATEATSTVGKQHHGATGVTDDVIARNVSVSLAYLKLVREMQGTCIPSSTVHTLLAASKEVGSNFKNTTFSAEFQVILCRGGCLLSIGLMYSTAL